ncbi:MAG: DUF167 domain-containing protein [Actinomycetota bacterium]
MASVTVRVLPRSDRTAVELSAGRIVVRVRSAPEDGRATEEARKALATALGVVSSSVTLRRGRRSREKVFEVSDLSRDEVLQRLL